MKTFTSLFLFFLIVFSTNGQTIISGKIYDEKKQAVIGASVYLKGTYDGASSDVEGKFKFTTSEKDTGTLTISSIGFETIEKKIILNEAVSLNIILKEAKSTDLNEVVITAGTFEASDEKKQTILKPLDIVTTAGALADISQALQTLPGTSRVGEQEGLFVRGGSANETKTLMDGLTVQNPFFSSTPNVATRGRFSPFLFKGTSFSTGGYSAQFGQALSSVLVLNSNDLPAKSSWNLGANVASVYGGKTKRWKNTSLAVDGNYFNVGPALYKLNKQNIKWSKAPQGMSGNLIFRHKPKENAILKGYINYANNTLGMSYPDATTVSGSQTFSLKNHIIFSNISYSETIGKWTLSSGFSHSYNHDKLKTDTFDIVRADNRIQGRFTASRDISENVTITAGTELHHYGYQNGYQQWKYSFNDTYWATFAESDIYLTKKLVARAGIRNEYSKVLNKWNLATRISLAYKTGNYSQISMAAGQFYQNPGSNYLFTNHQLEFEKANHLIFNYQIVKNERTFRVETYYKDYQNLVVEHVSGSFDSNQYRFPGGNTDNSGHGYAKGLDVFFRDKKTFKNSDYWISYSFLDTKRLFANYLTEASPTFTSKNNFTVVYKQYIPKINSQFGITYNFSEGRPYYNPNNPNFLQDKTPNYNNLSMSFNYLTNIKNNFTVIYVSIDNVLGLQNVYGYRYSQDGTQRISTNPPSYRSFFIGINISIDKVITE